MPSLIELKGVTKKFGKKVVLNDLDLGVFRGEIFGVIGASGSGKTTLLKILIGFYKPDKGNLFFESQPFSKIRGLGKKFGFATQESCFYPRLTIKENIEHFGGLYGLSKEELRNRVDNLLNMVELDIEKNVLGANLSGGMQKRLDIACAMVHRPAILILDEPTANLDPFLRKDILRLIKHINNQGTTVIIASHFLGEVDHLCNRVGILNKGRIVNTGTTEELKNLYTKSEEIHLKTNPGRYDVIERMLRKYNLNIDSINKHHNKMIIFTSEAERVLHYILHILESTKENLIDVDVKRPSLSEVFTSLTTENVPNW